MRLTINSGLYRYAAIIVTIVISVAMAWSSATSWFSYIYAGDPPPGGLKDAISLERDNAEFYFLLGQYYDIYDFTAPREDIYGLYKKALELNPFNYNYWLSLARFLSKEGRRDEALFTLNQATQLSPGIVSLRWDAGMLASELGDTKALLDNLSSVITNDPHRRKKAFIVLWQTLRNGDQILNIVSDEALPQYMHFLISTHRTSEAEKAWEKLSKKNEIREDLFLRYVGFLIRENELSRAKQAWVDRFGDWNGVWNGNFKHKILNGGFGWKIRNVDGAKITERANIDGNSDSIKIEFDGKHNIDYKHLSQVVLVEENSKYKLSSFMKTKDISTSNGLFWQVYCLDSKELYSESEQVRGTSDLQQVTLSFETPEDCRSVVIRLKRDKSNKIDRNISGTLWIDEVALEKE